MRRLGMEKNTGDPDRILYPLGGRREQTAAIAAADKRYDKHGAAPIQTFQIPFAGVRIRATYVEN